ncbi:MAG TPA: bifunctional phosphoribosyl-AMP cyclohydrolase/phosphoribosyl-ATP diphosphatase HisIE [Pyrinomonadaceae bacterium]|nr:bifunctional phosphoribosyl-AMP cyclohydrolase/phosphoribosyl-ATP diphosphatase HisIE [Pyrinomonadaceae bacterium]
MKIDFSKSPDNLVPVIVQDSGTGKVLMLGYMNEEAFAETERTGKVTFFSRSRRKLWTKGETSGNFLHVEQILIDCDNDALLIKAVPAGATCHTGADTCFNERNESDDFLFELEKTIGERKSESSENSYTSRLFAEGIKRISQKVGEEAVEVVIEAQGADDEKLKGEAADLLYHLIVLLAARDLKLSDVSAVLRERRK